MQLFNKPKFHRVVYNFKDDSSGDVVIKSEQHIPQSFLDARKAERDAADAKGHIGDDMRVFSVPTFLLRKWKAEDGFDPMACREADDETSMELLREARRRLIAEGYSHFLNTNKTF
ncbi:hypothetical protein ACFZ8E_07535 [Methylobacterium sp. HMF5984]|uniref:hypothetical protein n=1 Tax=Methylobacterium sp. HMF5984 TaxID=3367370 RepID=UPI00385412A1